jgi:predicted ribosome quality control (RQC) complex YloA/Tae2 family protein
MRDRVILKDKPFHTPPSRGRNPQQLTSDELHRLKDLKAVEVVKGITEIFSISGRYAEELLHRAHVDKEKKCETLEDGDLNRIYNAVNELISHLESEKFSPYIAVDRNGMWVDVAPVQMARNEGYEHIIYETFNVALDEFHAKAIVDREEHAISSQLEDTIAEQKRILDSQQQMLEKVKDKPEQTKKIGDLIYSHLNQLQALMQRIWEEKKGGSDWSEIEARIREDKVQGGVPAIYFNSLNFKNLTLHVSIENVTFSINLRRSIHENAAFYYNQGKKDEKRREGARKAIEATKQRIHNLQREGKLSQKRTTDLKKRKKKAWYEKFRWFVTSDDLLVIGGKDAVSNEIVVKKHLLPSDLVFHADIAGAPFVALKTGSNTPSQQSIQEAAQLAASHSKAWKFQFSAIDVYWVHPHQLSKTPPSGEYIQKGAFIIKGKKNYLRKTHLRLAIGLDLTTTPISVIGGPPTAIESKTPLSLQIIPGDLPSSQLAKKILQELRRKADKEVRERFSEITIEMVQAFIPYGRGDIAT